MAALIPFIIAFGSIALCVGICKLFGISFNSEQNNSNKIK